MASKLPHWTSPSSTLEDFGAGIGTTAVAIGPFSLVSHPVQRLLIVRYWIDL